MGSCGDHDSAIIRRLHHGQFLRLVVAFQSQQHGTVIVSTPDSQATSVIVGLLVDLPGMNYNFALTSLKFCLENSAVNFLVDKANQNLL